ncbi:MAG: hypothetical protein ACHP9Y_05520 [Gammaproteobacteria bacterium]
MECFNTIFVAGVNQTTYLYDEPHKTKNIQFYPLTGTSVKKFYKDDYGDQIGKVIHKNQHGHSKFKVIHGNCPEHSTEIDAGYFQVSQYDYLSCKDINLSTFALLMPAAVFFMEMVFASNDSFGHKGLVNIARLIMYPGFYYAPIISDQECSSYCGKDTEYYEWALTCME